MTDIPALARGLSEAQRHQIFNGLDGDEVSNELALLGLAWKISTHFDFDAAQLKAGGWELRNSGIAVRDWLRENGG